MQAENRADVLGENVSRYDPLIGKKRSQVLRQSSALEQTERLDRRRDWVRRGFHLNLVGQPKYREGLQIEPGRSVVPVLCPIQSTPKERTKLGEQIGVCVVDQGANLLCTPVVCNLALVRQLVRVEVKGPWPDDALAIWFAAVHEV